ncbi:AAA family ATPase [Pontibacter sp. JAM-7]|uniref:bifunctional aminoglycoside phosphotransferase/ATP-binding protein n=1 Tax=Pontibacter sp. JAM-7 TaxID=3366581 RepID=UPI003AF9B08D
MQLIDSLRNPAVYPHPVTQIEVLETHISWIILTGEYAYKLKKPVDFGFLDFTTLEQREYFCHEELRLNQRLAPDIYLEVLPIGGSTTAPILASNENVLEFAVKMQQFEAQDRLDRLLANNQFKSEWIYQLARQIARFHRKVPIIAQDSPLGNPETIWDVVADNFVHITTTLAELDDCHRVQTLLHKTAQLFRRIVPQLEQRKLEGHVRECHGDLHLANITLYHGELRLFDCIEFNPRFSWIDTISDLAFLLMDLEANGEFGLANRCLNRYLELIGDYAALPLLNFYKSYRAMVRAKVAVLGPELDMATMRHYLSLTEHYASPKQPVLYLMQGLSGSGKSYLSQKILQHSPVIRLRSDVERKRLFKQLSKQGEMLELYGPQMNMLTLNHLFDLSNRLLRAGLSVIVDATFIRSSSRRMFIELATQQQVKVKIIACHCNEEALVNRLEKRQQSGNDISDANVKVMQQQQIHLQPLSEDEEAIATHIDTADTLAVTELLNQFPRFEPGSNDGNIMRNCQTAH